MAKPSPVRLSVFLLLGSVLVLSCGAAGSGSQERDFEFSAGNRASVQSNMPLEATGILLDLLEGYYRLKDGLAADDLARARNAILSFSQAVASLDTFILTSGSGYYHLWTARDSLRDAVAAMRNAAAQNNLNVLRPAFSKASSALHATCRLANLRGAEVYRFYDAAAFNDAGAYWLSYSPKIRNGKALAEGNPYFGKKMPEWGEVVDTLR